MTNSNPLKKSSNYYLASAIFSILISYFLSLREFNFESFIDAYTYVNMVTRYDMDSLEMVNIREPFFPIILSALGIFFNGNAEVFFLIQTLLILSIFFLFYKERDGLLSATILSIFILTVPAVFVLYTNLWRQLLATLIVIAAIKNRKNTKIFLVLISIGILTHFSSLILLISFILSLSKNKFVIIILTIAACLAVFISSYFLTQASFLSLYSDEGAWTMLRRVYLSMLILVLFLLAKKNFYLKWAVINSLICLFIVPEALFDRFSHISIFLNYFVLFQALKSALSYIIFILLSCLNIFLLFETQTFQKIILSFS
jgi:hypothetical protein